MVLICCLVVLLYSHFLALRTTVFGRQVAVSQIQISPTVRTWCAGEPQVWCELVRTRALRGLLKTAWAILIASIVSLQAESSLPETCLAGKFASVGEWQWFHSVASLLGLLSERGPDGKNKSAGEESWHKGDHRKSSWVLSHQSSYTPETSHEGALGLGCLL